MSQLRHLNVIHPVVPYVKLINIYTQTHIRRKTDMVNI